MIQIGLDSLFAEEAPSKEEPISVMQQLTAEPCQSCRLGLDTPSNPGFIWKGNPDAHVAVVGDTPSYGDMSCRRAFADDVGNQLADWLETAGVPLSDVFCTYIVQCKTPVTTSKIAKKNGQQRPPHADAETAHCFPVRCVRVLKAMPNLQVVWALGLTVMDVVLGGDPGIKSHQGFWFGTDLLPGVAVYGLPHPRDFDKTTSEIKKGRLKQHLHYFKNEYYGKKTSKGLELCPPRHVLNILSVREQERKEAKPQHDIF